jgi:NAD(P)-dependent dehydrogenase (short-subunit alcohol dehydrogenase family)
VPAAPSISQFFRRSSLSNQSIASSGAGQGIGRAFAHALGEAGAAVAVVDINKGKAEEVVKELRSKGIRTHAIQADVTQKKECKR